MKNLIFLAVVAAFVFIGCSKEDDSKCESCKGDSGTKYEICDNGDGTYTVKAGNGTITITEGELEGFTPKEYIEFTCAFDSGESDQ